MSVGEEGGVVEETSDGAVWVTGNRGRSPGLQVGVKVCMSVPIIRNNVHTCTIIWEIFELKILRSCDLCTCEDVR